jgi:hypothetical protein
LPSPPFTAPITISPANNAPPTRATFLPRPRLGPLGLAGCGCVQPCPHCEFVMMPPKALRMRGAEHYRTQPGRATGVPMVARP